MLSLRSQQSEFARKVALLVLFAYEQGYEVTLGDAQSLPSHNRHRRGSFHFKQLAIDLNLFKDGVYLKSTKSHEPLGIFWESIGGSWGGHFEDGNHYSLGEIV